MHEHHEPGRGEGSGKALEPVFLHGRIAMRHGDRGMPGRGIDTLTA
jgi:hypothetical protein